MYPNVDYQEGIADIKAKLENDPWPIGMSADYLAAGLQLCMECNRVKFRGRFYIPCKGCAQGTCHACTFTDLWVAKNVEKHLVTINIESIVYSIYRDDGHEILPEVWLTKRPTKNTLTAFIPI